MNDAQINNPWLVERVREVQASIAEIQQKVVPLGYLQLGWRPPEGGWSIAQVLEHLIITDESYLTALDRVLVHAPPGTAAGAWRPSIIGGLLTRSQRPESKRKMTTPAVWRPAPQPRARVVEDYIDVRRSLIRMLARADGHDLRRTKLSSPAAKWIRLNLGDAVMLLVVHTQRHLAQIDRIREHADFPEQ